MEKKNLILIGKIEEVEIVVDVENVAWTDPAIYLKRENKLTRITMPSREYDNELGTFFLETTNLTSLEKEIAEQAVNLIADPASLEDKEFGYSSITLFTLKKELLLKISHALS